MGEVMIIGFILVNMFLVNISLFRLWGMEAKRSETLINLLEAMLIQAEAIKSVIECIEFMDARFQAGDSHSLDELLKKITPDLTEGGNNG